MIHTLIEPLETRIAPAATLNISAPSSIIEGTGSDHTVTFTVSLSELVSTPVTVSYTTVDGSHANPLDNARVVDGDYNTASGVLTFAANTLTPQTFTVTIHGDAIFEHDEFFSAMLSNPVGASLGQGSVDAQIHDDDVRPTLSIEPATVAEGNNPANPNFLVFNVRLSGATSETITVNAATADGTATLADHDYTATNQTLTFAPGETLKTFSVPVTGDTKGESDETILANLSSITGSVTPGAQQATGTITTDDARISIGDAQVVEGAGGATSVLAFKVSLDSVAAGQVVPVNFTTMDGTAVSFGTIAAGTKDYVSQNGALTLTADASGHAEQMIMVTVNNDTVAENNETLSVKLSGVADTITVTKATGVGTITDDDPGLIITGGSVTEGNLGDIATKTITFTVSAHSLTPGQQAEVDYATMDGTAVSTGTVQAGTNDYIPTGTLHLELPAADANGNASKTFTVTVNGDGVTENNEVFNVNLSNPSIKNNPSAALQLQIASAQGTIIDNDANVLTINNVTIVEGDAGQQQAVFTVSLTPAAASVVTVNFATMEGSAVSSGLLPDYTAKSGTLTFAAGTTTQTIIVPILGDLVHEGDETFTIQLSNPTGNASIANDVGIGTIKDNGDPLPTITLSPASVLEGDAGDTHTLSFVATLSAPSQSDVTVNYNTADGTATVGNSDYTAKTAMLTFAAGSTTPQMITIDVTGDITNEANETMSVQLSNVSANATIGTGSAIGTILNDDIHASIANATFTEGDVNTTGTMTVTLDAAPLPGSTVTVNFALNGGSAALNTDVKLHDPTITSLTFGPGDLTKTITLDIIGDTINEADENFTVALTGATGAVIDQTHPAGVSTIHDNDPLPTLSVANAQITEGDANTSNLTFTVTLSSVSGQTVKVNASTVDGTALAGSDYTATLNQMLTFAPGETIKTVTVPIIGDTVDELTETFKLQLSSPTNATLAAGHDAGIGTILDNDQRAVSISDASIDEGNAGDIHHLTFTVSIPSAAAQDITVAYDTLDGTAKAGTDYTKQLNGTVTIPQGMTSKTFTIDVLGNNTPQANRTMTVKLRDPINGMIADGLGVGTIVDDEASYKLVTKNGINDEDDATTTPKTVTYTVVRSGSPAALAIPGSVTFTTADGTAIAGSDYIAQSGTLNFAAGQTEKTITVNLRKDFAHENMETFLVELTGSNSGVLRDANDVIQTTVSQTATIRDNDALPTITINSPTVVEGNPANSTTTTDLTFVVSLSSADETQPVTVTYMTVDGTGETGAISVPNGSRPADFTAIGPTTLTIPVGQLTNSFVVHVNRDTILEGDETFTVKLSNPVGGETFAVGGDTGTGTIKNDDGGPGITFSGANNGNLSLFEGGSGSTPATFTVQLSGPSEQTVTVDVGLGAGSATLGTDFTNTNVPTTLTFAPGETSKTFSYSVLGDMVSEADETFSVVLNNAKNGTLSNSTAPVQATVTIKNDDIAPSLAINSVSGLEGNSGTSLFNFTVTLNGQSDQPVTVDYVTSDAAAQSGGSAPDYLATQGTLTFAPGETVKTISVPVIGDTIKEINESFNVSLKNVSSNATITQAAGAGTILDDGDTTYGIEVFDAKTVEGDSGTKNAGFNIQLSSPNATGAPITVHLATRNGTAVAGSDYTAQDMTVTFNPPGVDASGNPVPGEVAKTVNVPLVGDTVFEATESYFLTASNATGAQILGNGEGRGTIYNDDLQIVDAQTVRYVDADGDLATVHITKGPLTTTGAHPVLTFDPVNTIGGRTLEMIDFTSNRIIYNHTDLSVMASPQPGFAASGGNSDGRVNVGYIQGGIPQGNLFQIFDNIDFGNITVQGDVGKIVAGDQVATDRAVQTLNLFSHGAQGTGTGAPDNVSIFLGGVGRIHVSGDWNGVLESVGGDTGDIQSLIIQGALRGSADPDAAGSGQIFFTGTLTSATIGSIIGGAGTGSGAVFGNLTNDATQGSGASIGSLHILGDVIGGTGADSGRILAPLINNVTIDGKLVGGTGKESGIIQGGVAGFGGGAVTVLVKGDVVGGAGDNSGEIFGAALGTITVRGSITGGAGDDSGSIVTQGAAAAVKVFHNITGAGGARSGSVQVAKSLANFQVGVAATSPDGNLVGGSGDNSGTISMGGSLTVNGAIFGSIIGGTGSASGGVNATGVLAAIQVGHDLIGGSSSFATASGGATDVNTSGFIAANRIGPVVIGGSIKSGTNGGTSLIGSGTIRANGDIASLVVGGDIVGTADQPVVIAAGGAASAALNQTIGSLTVKGNTSYADILGGYGGTISTTAPLGTPTNPDAQVGTIRLNGTVLGTNIVAGIDAGDDGLFGTEDDAVITGALTDSAAIKSKIAAIIIKGPIQTNTDIFGIVAQVIASASVNGVAVALSPTMRDTKSLGGDTTNFLLREV